jgi:hypothetical protein
VVEASRQQTAPHLQARNLQLGSPSGRVTTPSPPDTSGQASLKKGGEFAAPQPDSFLVLDHYSLIFSN